MTLAVFSSIFVPTRSECDMRGYLVIDLKRKRSRVVATLQEAARIVGAEAADIEWWLEEEGTWEGQDWVVGDIVIGLPGLPSIRLKSS
jgi:hypothetical protein